MSTSEAFVDSNPWEVDLEAEKLGKDWECQLQGLAWKCMKVYNVFVSMDSF